MSKFFNQEFKGMNCSNIAAEIKQLRDELAKRVDDLKVDKYGLPASGKNSIAGHIQQMDAKQKRLRKLLDEYNSRGCGDGIPPDAFKFATAESPVNYQGVNREAVAKAAAVLGVGVVVLLAVYSAPALAVTGALASLVMVVNQN